MKKEESTDGISFSLWQVIIAAPTILSQSGTAPFAGEMLNHVTLGVSDVARSKKFYQSLLGCLL